jgi:hypothetical protein
MWVFIRPGVVRITICSCVRLRVELDSVQFIVLMVWIRFPCLNLKPFQQRAIKIQTVWKQPQDENLGVVGCENSRRERVGRRIRDGSRIASGLCGALPVAELPSARLEYSGTIS